MLGLRVGVWFRVWRLDFGFRMVQGLRVQGLKGLVVEKSSFGIYAVRLQGGHSKGSCSASWLSALVQLVLGLFGWDLLGCRSVFCPSPALKGQPRRASHRHFSEPYALDSQRPN